MTATATCRNTCNDATVAGLVVNGSYFLEGQTLKLDANIFDAGATKVFWHVEPASGPKEQPSQASTFSNETGLLTQSRYREGTVASPYFCLPDAPAKK